jgi:hypothetical protein
MSCNQATDIAYFRFLICDADTFTRKYFKDILNITQGEAIDVSEKKPPPPVVVSKSV